MGLDMSYQAIPPESRLIKMVKDKPQWGFQLGYSGFKSISEEELNNRNDDADLFEYAAEVEKVRREHKGIEKRNLYLGRKWDMLHYLLSENRRDNDAAFDDNDWAYRAINGGDKLGEKICMSQGIPITYLTADEVKKIWWKMDNITAESLEDHWDPPAMREAGVYKIHADEDWQTLEYVKEDFEKLKEFYLWAAIYKEGVLVFCD